MTEDVEQKCWRGHTWNAPMYYELGGWFYCDENHAFCPECNAAVGDTRPGVPRLFIASKTVEDATKKVERHRDWQRCGFGVCLTWPEQEAS